MNKNDSHFETNSAELLTTLGFSMHANPGVYGLLVGSGLSRAAEIPTGWEITLDLVRRLAIADDVPEQDDWEAWYLEKHGKEPSYSDLVARIGRTANERQALLQSYIEPMDEDRQEGRKVPTKAHEAIADLVYAGFVRVVITTNFDRLIEHALQARGVEPTVIDSVDALNGAEPLTHTKCYLVKLHGDYKDARILNTVAELSDYPPEYDSLLDRILDEHGLVVCGWSGEWDEALFHALIRCPSRRYSLFWAARGELGDAAERIVSHRKGQVIDIETAEDFFGSLRDQVHTLARTHRRDPRTVDLLVRTTKRYAAKPEHRIDLHDLVEDEVRRLLERLRTATPDVRPNNDGVRALVPFYESTTEPLARMLGVLGRWGNETDVDTAMDAIVTLATRGPDESAGSIHHLRLYPAVLALSAYAVGLTIAKQWHALHTLLSRQLPNDPNGPERVVDEFAKWVLDGYRNELWKRLPGLEGHLTPMSDHLYEVLDKWRESFGPTVADFEEQFDVWEILASVTYCETDDSWAPLGRNGRRYVSRERVIHRVGQGGDLHVALRKAGFGGRPGLTTCVKRYVGIVSQVRRW